LRSVGEGGRRLTAARRFARLPALPRVEPLVDRRFAILDRFDSGLPIPAKRF